MAEEKKFNKKDYKTSRKPVWCPGCGDYSVLNSLYSSFEELQLDPKDIAVISGIGCSSRLPGYVNTYSFNTIHGRGIPIASGVKLASPNTTVVAVGGDGDGLAIGGGHLPHAARRNINLTYILMDNQIYGLTKGQLSPTSELNLKTKTSMYGSIDRPINPAFLALAYGVSFIARAFSGNPKHLTEMITKAIQHEGFSLVHVLSPCVTFRGKSQFTYFKENTEFLPKQHDPSNKGLALTMCESLSPIFLGILYHTHYPTYTDRIDKLRNSLPKEDKNCLLDKYVVKKYEI